MHPSWWEAFPSFAVNPFPPSCAGFGERGSQTELVHNTLANKSNLHMMAFGPLLLSLITSNSYISHRFCRFIYQGKKEQIKTY